MDGIWRAVAILLYLCKSLSCRQRSKCRQMSSSRVHIVVSDSMKNRVDCSTSESGSGSCFWRETLLLLGRSPLTFDFRCTRSGQEFDFFRDTPLTHYYYGTAILDKREDFHLIFLSVYVKSRHNDPLIVIMCEGGSQWELL